MRIAVRVDFVGRADFDERRAAAAQHVGQPKAAADLDELVARDDDFAIFGKGVENQQDRRRTIVDNDTVFGTRRLA
jgi:hypothetical protein